MHNLTFKCTFLSDVILDLSTATEGTSPSLRYIPGSNFLGIVARHYKSFDSEKAFELFHSGNVRFGDAHLSTNNNRSLKMPASWFFKKDDKEKERPYIHHAITKNMRDDFPEKGIQLKQVRTGYFDIETGQKIDTENNFSIKSAYNIEERRSADEQLYGYNALRKGSNWLFTVEADDESLLNEIKEKLKGRHNIGRSRSAQYGRVKIEEHAQLTNKRQQNEPVEIVDNKGNRFLVIYFESCATFVDEYGEATFNPLMSDLKTGLEDKNIMWENSQILTRSFSPWNGKRKARDADRVCIDKGSVLVIQIDNNFDLKLYRDAVAFGVGLYRQEGFGKVIINPQFLSANADAEYQCLLKKSEKIESASIEGIIDKDDSDNKALEWINAKTEINRKTNEILHLTNEFIKNNELTFENITSSQWGTIREIVSRHKDFNKAKLALFEKPGESNKGVSGILYRGKSEKRWRRCRDILEKEANKISDGQTASRFLICLCTEMAKKKNK